MKKYFMSFFLIGLCLSSLAVFSQPVMNNKGGDRQDLAKRLPQKLNPREIKENLNNIKFQQSLVFQNQIRAISLNLISTQQKTIRVPCCFASSLNSDISSMMPLPYSANSNGPLSMPTAFESKVEGLTFITASQISAFPPLVIDYGSMLSESIIDSVVSIQPPAQPRAE
jgi:hypothetical protein